MEPWLLRAAALLYLFGAGRALVGALRPASQSHPRTGYVAVGLAMALHFGALVIRAIQLGGFPIAGIHDGLSGFGFLASALALAVATRGGVPQVVTFTSGMVAVLVLLASFMDPQSSGIEPGLRSAWLYVHIGLALLADAAFAIAGVVSIVYLVQERRLKQKRAAKPTTGLHNLPALEVLDRVGLRLVQWGFPLMTLGLLSGALYGREVWGTYWTWDPRNTVSALVWLLYAVMLHARIMVGWRGRKAAILTVVGVIALLVAFIGLGLAGVGTHGKAYVS